MVGAYTKRSADMNPENWTPTDIQVRTFGKEYETMHGTLIKARLEYYSLLLEIPIRQPSAR